MLDMHLHPAELVRAAARTVDIAQPDHHSLDPVAGSDEGEAQTPPGVIQKRGGEREPQALDFDAHARFLLVA